tara:strand:- start:159 stop:545 length:387 start_codon:yes stop_codon:yes gene_type:complete
MENEVFKTDQTSEIGVQVKPHQSNTASRGEGPVLSKNINDSFVSVPPEKLSKYLSELGDVDSKLREIDKNLKKIPNIIRLNKSEINLKKGTKRNNEPRVAITTADSLAERLAKISKVTKTINLDLDLN